MFTLIAFMRSKLGFFFFFLILYCFIIWVSFYFNKKWKFVACYSFWFLLRAIWAVSMSNYLVYLFYLSKKLSGSVFFIKKLSGSVLISSNIY